MSELSIIKKEVRKGIQLGASDLWMLLTGLCAGISSAATLTGILVFCTLGYFYQKSLQQFFEFLLTFLLGSLYVSFTLVYQNVLLVMFFCLLLLFVRVLHISLFHCMPMLIGSVCFLAAVVHLSSVYLGLQAALCGFVLMKLCSSERILIRREFVISEMIMSILIALTALLLQRFISSQQLLFLVILYLCFCALYFQGEAFLASLFLFSAICQNDASLLMWIAGVIVLYFLQSIRKTMFFIFPFVITIMTKQIEQGALALLIMVIVHYLPQRSLIPFLDQHNEDHLLKLRLRNKEQVLQHHLHQFSHVFDLIADYYGEHFDREVSFLQGMSQVMSELSLSMKQCALSQEDEAVRIMEILKGYHYDVMKVYVSQSDTGSLHVVLMINDCLRKDVDDVVLPVLQMNVNQNLKLVSYRKAQKFSNTVRMEFASEKPCGFKAKAYRSLDQNKVSGDTCAIFQSGNHTICTISDGMGTGKIAEKTSQFVTALTQRLLVCGMPIEMIVKCINSLCTLHRNDQYATLDFMCMDALNHRIILSKNGAAPSYLIRGSEVLKIEGHALPLGIVKQINADCYQLDVKAKDVIVMCSDGADEQMIQKWMCCRSVSELKRTVEQCLKQQNKKDDITVIVAEIL